MPSRVFASANGMESFPCGFGRTARNRSLLQVRENLPRQQDRHLLEGPDSQPRALRQLIECIGLSELRKIGDVVRFLPDDITGAGHERSSDIDQRLSFVAAEKSCHTEAIGIDR